ncbi:unnamed protein product [Prorocentrum cordatum]|uniref:Uncharacterized protein n=1 Tax=Prorocentrum cordatum TaxID=2364126 RepID=A0ABN9VI30_9DINO|nr:unnamed protein product [Polarella glacialis]
MPNHPLRHQPSGRMDDDNDAADHDGKGAPAFAAQAELQLAQAVLNEQLYMPMKSIHHRLPNLKGLILQEKVFELYGVKGMANIVVPFFKDGKKTMEPHPLNLRRQDVIVNQCTNLVLENGNVPGVRGEPWAVASPTTDSFPLLMISYGTLTRAVYNAHERAPGNPFVKRSIERGLQNVTVFDARLPDDVLTWLRDWHNEWHGGSRFTLIQCWQLISQMDSDFDALSTSEHRYEKIWDYITDTYKSVSDRKIRSENEFIRGRTMINLLKQLKIMTITEEFLGTHCKFTECNNSVANINLHALSQCIFSAESRSEVDIDVLVQVWKDALPFCLPMEAMPGRKTVYLFDKVMIERIKWILSPMAGSAAMKKCRKEIEERKKLEAQALAEMAKESAESLDPGDRDGGDAAAPIEGVVPAAPAAKGRAKAKSKAKAKARQRGARAAPVKKRKVDETPVVVDFDDEANHAFWLTDMLTGICAAIDNYPELPKSERVQIVAMLSPLALEFLWCGKVTIGAVVYSKWLDLRTKLASLAVNAAETRSTTAIASGRTGADVTTLSDVLLAALSDGGDPSAALEDESCEAKLKSDLQSKMNELTGPRLKDLSNFFADNKIKLPARVHASYARILRDATNVDTWAHRDATEITHMRRVATALTGYVKSAVMATFPNAWFELGMSIVEMTRATSQIPQCVEEKLAKELAGPEDIIRFSELRWIYCDQAVRDTAAAMGISNLAETTESLSSAFNAIPKFDKVKAATWSQWQELWVESIADAMEGSAGPQEVAMDHAKRRGLVRAAAKQQVASGPRGQSSQGPGEEGAPPPVVPVVQKVHPKEEQELMSVESLFGYVDAKAFALAAGSQLNLVGAVDVPEAVIVEFEHEKFPSSYFIKMFFHFVEARLYEHAFHRTQCFEDVSISWANMRFDKEKKNQIVKPALVVNRSELQKDFKLGFAGPVSFTKGASGLLVAALRMRARRRDDDVVLGVYVASDGADSLNSDCTAPAWLVPTAKTEQQKVTMEVGAEIKEYTVPEHLKFSGGGYPGLVNAEKVSLQLWDLIPVTTEGDDGKEIWPQKGDELVRGAKGTKGKGVKGAKGGGRGRANQLPTTVSALFGPSAAADYIIQHAKPDAAPKAPQDGGGGSLSKEQTHLLL